MKIATWNIDRLRYKTKLNAIIEACEEVGADILVLTEADDRVQLSEYRTVCWTALPHDHELLPYAIPVHYALSERRVIIYSKYPCVQQHVTYDETTAICTELETDRGNLLVYGSIIGIHGHRKPFFTDELRGQMSDLRRLAGEGHQICFLGDYNCSFADNYYLGRDAKSAILRCFEENDMTLLTEDMPECIDHIAISKCFTGTASIYVEEWNKDKLLSDHKGIAVNLI